MLFNHIKRCSVHKTMMQRTSNCFRNILINKCIYCAITQPSLCSLMHCVLQLPCMPVLLLLFFPSNVMYLALSFCVTMLWTLLFINSMQIEADRMRLRLGHWRCSTLHPVFWGQMSLIFLSVGTNATFLAEIL